MIRTITFRGINAHKYLYVKEGLICLRHSFGSISVTNLISFLNYFFPTHVRIVHLVPSSTSTMIICISNYFIRLCVHTLLLFMDNLSLFLHSSAPVYYFNPTSNFNFFIIYFKYTLTKINANISFLVGRIGNRSPNLKWINK